MATPQFHHWHHAAEPQAIDRNFAVHVPVLDVIFRTAYLPAHWPSAYGLTHGEAPPPGYGGQFVWPFRRQRGEGLMAVQRILITVLATTLAAHASAQGNHATRREAGISGGALMTILGVQPDDSPLQVQPRRAHKTGGDIMLPFQVRNVTSSAVKGFRLVAFIVSEDGTVRFRQPFESSREIGAGKAWSGEMTLRQPLVTSSHSAVFVVEQASTETGAFELPRAEAEQAALEMFRMSTGRK